MKAAKLVKLSNRTRREKTSLQGSFAVESSNVRTRFRTLRKAATESAERAYAHN